MSAGCRDVNQKVAIVRLGADGERNMMTESAGPLAQQLLQSDEPSIRLQVRIGLGTFGPGLTRPWTLPAQLGEP